MLKRINKKPTIDPVTKGTDTPANENAEPVANAELDVSLIDILKSIDWKLWEMLQSQQRTEAILKKLADDAD